MNWESLSAAEFKVALGQADGVCLWPIGCLEKHGDHLPLGTDIAIAREIARRAAAIEPFLIFPYHPFGFVSEVRHQPGTIALETRQQLALLDAVCDEMARNGCTKIVFGNGHGGNGHALRAFAVSRLERPRNDVVFVCDLWGLTPAQAATLAARHGAAPVNTHGDLVETSCLMALAPQCVHMDRVRPGQGRALGRMAALEQRGVFTGLNWYGSYPDQIAGDPAGASAAYGNDILDCNAQNLAEAIREIKRSPTAQLAQAFYAAAGQPAR